MRLLIDMNLSPKWVAFLQSSGFEAAHWANVGVATALDSEIMAYAKAGSWVIFTHDLDFGAFIGSNRWRCAERCPDQSR